MVELNALAATKLYKRIIRHYCMTQIKQKKEDNLAWFEEHNIDAEELFVDFKLDLSNNDDANILKLLNKARAKI